MQTLISPLDWAVVAAYLAALIGFAVWLSRRQHHREDYYVGNRRIGAWPVAVSIMATQCSTNSILGAPAFVAFAAGGGLVWLQYELALPLAMIVLMTLVMPAFRRLRLVSVYEYLERRFDLKTRLTVSGLFLFVRAFATSVTVYSIAIVVDLITGIGFFWSVVLLGLFTLVYDVLGGIRGVVYSDVAQMLILVAVLILLLVLLLQETGGFLAMLQQLPDERQQTLNFRQHGLGDGETFAFWPMLLGGFFLYLAYYGCDQSQVQRQLSTDSLRATNKALLLNGLLRFPLVLLYCLVGAALAAYAAAHPEFLLALPQRSGAPDYNLAVPLYMLNALPVGLVGLAIVALFAAAMSSLDSVINSLSATTMEDFVRRFHTHGSWSERKELFLSRLITTIWGIVTLLFSFQVGDIAPTVLEAINKIGSLANGPILAVFALGLLTQRGRGRGAVSGLIIGVLINAAVWRWLPQVSWLWWNVIGFAAALLIGLLVSLHTAAPIDKGTTRPPIAPASRTSPCGWLLLLGGWFAVLTVLLAALEAV